MADTLAETTKWGNLKTELQAYVGIDTAFEQNRRKLQKRGLEFNLIVVGRSGLGKSTLINTLFKANVSRRDFSTKEGEPPQPYKIPQTTEIKCISHVLEEKGLRLRLTITDTPGFGDQMNNEGCWLPIIEYITQQYEKYLSEEQSVNRKKHIPDTRVHCCLYFISPSGHKLSNLDIECMRRLCKWVNVIPVIGKSDSLTPEERAAFKRQIKRDLEESQIVVYPQTILEEDAEDQVVNNKLREKIPFAVVGSMEQHQMNGRSVYGRKTRWGVVDVENRMHCDFPDLRDMIIRTHMQDLIDVTQSHHYENFRLERLQGREHVHMNGHPMNNIANLNESSL